MGEIRGNMKQWLTFLIRKRAKGRKPREKGQDAGALDSPAQPFSQRASKRTVCKCIIHSPLQ